MLKSVHVIVKNSMEIRVFLDYESKNVLSIQKMRSIICAEFSLSDKSNSRFVLGVKCLMSQFCLSLFRKNISAKFR